jgi:ribonuclease-3
MPDPTSAGENAPIQAKPLSLARTALQKKLGHQFADPSLLERALTHSSLGGDSNNERLEFLGDRVLGLVIAELLCKMYPQDSEGDLAKRHAALVQGKILTRLAREIDFGAAIQLSDAERSAGGSNNDNILADGLEAVIGAIYLDGGLAPCRSVICALWQDSVKNMTQPPQDPKTALQEWAQGRGLPLPEYELVGREGPDHAPKFRIRVCVTNYPPATAAGASRRKAEKEAAAILLAHLREMYS